MVVCVKVKVLQVLIDIKKMKDLHPLWLCFQLLVLIIMIELVSKGRPSNGKGVAIKYVRVPPKRLKVKFSVIYIFSISP